MNAIRRQSRLTPLTPMNPDSPVSRLPKIHSNNVVFPAPDGPVIGFDLSGY